jgi:predicted DNA-binding protein (MmcQ/YjbR family)
MTLRRDALLAFCRSLPHVTEDIKWGADLCFSIGGKMFALFRSTRGAGFTCKVSEMDFPVVTGFPGVVPAPYLARAFWVAVHDDAEVTEAQAIRLLRESYQWVFAKLPAGVRKKLQPDSATASTPTARAAKPAAKRARRT